MASTISPDPQRIGAAQRHDRQFADGQIEDGEIGVRILADDGRLGDAAVGKLHPDRIGARDHVLVGDDRALRVHDHARAQTALHALAVARPIVAEQLIERRRAAALGDHARRVDIDHGRRGARDRVGEALHDHDGARGSGRRAGRRAGRGRGRGRGRRGGDGAQQRGLPPDDEEGDGQADHDCSQQKTRKDARVLQSDSSCALRMTRVSVYNAPAIFFGKHYAKGFT